MRCIYEHVSSSSQSGLVVRALFDMIAYGGVFGGNNHHMLVHYRRIIEIYCVCTCTVCEADAPDFDSNF